MNSTVGVGGAFYPAGTTPAPRLNVRGSSRCCLQLTDLAHYARPRSGAAADIRLEDLQDDPAVYSNTCYTALQTSMLIVDAYREDLAYIHDVGYGAIARDAAERLITELTRARHPSGTVVDLGCGSGILAGALVEAGYQVVGIDMSDGMVALARVRAPDAEFHVGSFVSVALPTSVAVTAIGEVVNYAFDPANDEPALADLVRRAYEALVPGGILLFDVAGPDRAPSSESHRTHATGRDWAMFVETTVEPGTGVLTRHITSFRQIGDLYRRDDEVHRLVLRETEAVLELLRLTGFEPEILPGYQSVPLPRGVVAFLGRKPVPHAV